MELAQVIKTEIDNAPKDRFMDLPKDLNLHIFSSILLEKDEKIRLLEEKINKLISVLDEHHWIGSINDLSGLENKPKPSVRWRTKDIDAKELYERVLPKINKKYIPRAYFLCELLMVNIIYVHRKIYEVIGDDIIQRQCKGNFIHFDVLFFDTSLNK